MQINIPFLFLKLHGFYIETFLVFTLCKSTMFIVFWRACKLHVKVELGGSLPFQKSLKVFAIPIFVSFFYLLHLLCVFTMSLLQLPLSFSNKLFFNAQGSNLIDIILLCQSFPIFDPLSPLSSFDPIKSSLDLNIESLKLKPKNLEKKHRKKEWQFNQVFQEMWVMKLPWVEINDQVWWEIDYGS